MKEFAKSVIPNCGMNLLRKLRCLVLTIRFRIFGRKPARLETSKARARRIRENFFEEYCKGQGLDIGYGGDLLAPNCRGWDFEHGDAQFLRKVKDSSFDFVYSSHLLEHMEDPSVALKNWWRVLKPGGYLLLYMPHRELYEKRNTLPSRWNPSHKHFFLPYRDEPPDTIGLVPLIERSLKNFRIVYVRECSEGHTITDPRIHSDGEYSIEAVIQKLE
ncbi:MAG: methyltransferase domain-containing protein [Acidobacteriota bacterium]